MIAASLKFPTLEFETECADEGGGFVCENAFVNGDMSEYEHEWDSADSIRVRENVGLYHPEDEVDFA